jgi:hypothetical protein
MGKSTHNPKTQKIIYAISIAHFRRSVVDDCKLINDKFHIEILKVNDITFEYYESINKDQTLIQSIKNIIKEDIYNLFHSLDLPIFLKKDNIYYAVSRYWLINYIIDNKDKIYSFPAIIFTDAEDKELIQKLLALDQTYASMVSQSLPSNKPDSAKVEDATYQTEQRSRLKTKGRICPRDKCKGILVKDNKRKVKVGHPIHCQKYNDPSSPCGFHAVLTDYEFDPPFKKENLNTNEWISILDNEKCGKCQGPVFRRTVFHSEINIDVVDHCSKFYLEEKPSCKWERKMTSEEVSISFPDLKLNYYKSNEMPVSDVHNE